MPASDCRRGFTLTGWVQSSDIGPLKGAPPMNCFRRLDWIVVVTCLLIATGFGCGGGCGGCGITPIPGGFKPAKRTANAGQLRVTQSGLTAVGANPAGLIGSIAGGSGGV